MDFDFNPRSLAGATRSAGTLSFLAHISIHAPLRERQHSLCIVRTAVQFQSTLPCGSDCNEDVTKMFKIISIHAPLRERLNGFRHTAAAATISIHAPLRERPEPFIIDEVVSTISIHAPLRERLARSVALTAADVFQSTLPCGSDRLNPWVRRLGCHFNPRSLAGATASKQNTSPFI